MCLSRKQHCCLAGGLKGRVGQPNRTSDFHFSPYVPLQPSSTSQRDRHGFPSNPCGSTCQGVASSTLGWKQARDDLGEGHRACVAKFLLFSGKASMNAAKGLRGRRDRLNLLKIQRRRNVFMCTNPAQSQSRRNLCASARSNQAEWTLPHTSRLGAAAVILADWPHRQTGKVFPLIDDLCQRLERLGLLSSARVG